MVSFPLPTALYGVVLLMAAIACTILQTAIVAHQGSHSKQREAPGGDFKGKLSMAAYAAAIPLACVTPWMAIGLYVFVALLWLVPDGRIESRIGR